MPDHPSPDQLLSLLTRLQLAHTEAALCAKELEGLLASMFVPPPTAEFDFPLIDVANRTVHWDGKVCRFSSPTRFRLFQRLARQPNRYVTYHQLCREVWDGHPRSRETVRSTIRLLKHDLRIAGMDELADGISGQDQRYVLMLSPASAD